MSFDADHITGETLDNEIAGLPIKERVAAVLGELNDLAKEIPIGEKLTAEQIVRVQLLISSLIPDMLDEEVLLIVPEVLDVISKAEITSPQITGYLFAQLVTLLIGCNTFSALAYRYDSAPGREGFEGRVVSLLIRTLDNPFLPDSTRASALSMLIRYGKYSQIWEDKLMKTFGVYNSDTISGSSEI